MRGPLVSWISLVASAAAAVSGIASGGVTASAAITGTGGTPAASPEGRKVFRRGRSRKTTPKGVVVTRRAFAGGVRRSGVMRPPMR